jgi:hypothetical protein
MMETLEFTIRIKKEELDKLVSEELKCKCVEYR